VKDLLDPPTPPKSGGLTQGQKTAILWLVLIMMVVSIYQIFTPPHPAHGPQPERDWTGPLSILPLAALIIGWFVWVGRRTARFNRENGEGIALLNKGASAQAAAAFEALVPRYKKRNLRTVARHNAGVARLREGKLDRAIELLTLVVNDKQAPNLKASAAIELASACALAGRLEEADTWLATAEGAGNANRHNLVWPRALVNARHGRYAELARMLESHWRELENTLSGEVLRRLTVLRAFAVASAEGPRGAGVAEPLLLRLRPSVPGEYAWLAGQWPELGAFLETNQL
jgi:hypothetical protein